MKGMKHILGVVVLTAVMTVGAIEVFTPRGVGACPVAHDCATAEMLWNEFAKRNCNAPCGTDFALMVERYCGYYLPC